VIETVHVVASCTYPIKAFFLAVLLERAAITATFVKCHHPQHLTFPASVVCEAEFKLNWKRSRRIKMPQLPEYKVYNNGPDQECHTGSHEFKLALILSSPESSDSFQRVHIKNPFSAAMISGEETRDIHPAQKLLLSRLLGVDTQRRVAGGNRLKSTSTPT